MPSRRVIFLDVDGTYAAHGAVPAAHVAAVRAARAAGHLVLLCTGRPVSALPETLTGAGFDGVVGGAGAYAVLADRVLLDTRFPAALAARAVAALTEHGTLFILEAPEALYAPPGSTALIARARRAYSPGHADRPHGGPRIDELDDLGSVAFGKIICFGGDTPLEQIAAEIGPAVAMVPSSVPELGAGAGEIYQAHITKAVGMRAVMDAIGVEPDAVVAFGDGLNDIEMLELAGTAVAIEGSDPRVIAAAGGRTCAGPAMEGLAVAFAELGLA